MLRDRVSNSGPLTYESGALPIALHGPACYRLVDSSTVMCWISPFVILGVSGLFCHFYSYFDGKSC